MFFWNSVAFPMIQGMLAIWSLVPLPFQNPACTSGSSWFTYCWSLALRTLSITLLACELVQLYSSLNNLWHCPSLGLERKLTFSSPVATAEFSQFANIIGCSTYTASTLRILNSSAGIPSPLLALFTVMLPKAHLTSHWRMSSSRWVTTPSWLSESLRPFWYSSSVYSCYLFLISSASVRFLLFLSFTMPILAWNIPLISPVFLKRFIVFPTLLFSSISLIVHFKRLLYLSLLFSGTVHSVGYIFAFLLCLLLLFFPQLFVRPPQTTTLPSYITFSLRWFWSLPSIQCHKPPSKVLSALCQI